MRRGALLASVLLAAAAAVHPSDAPAQDDAIDVERLQIGDRVERDGQSTRTMDMRVRLRTPQAVSQFGQIGMPYVEGLGDVQFQDVAIDKPDGRHIEVKNALVEDINPYGVSSTSMPADVRFRKLTLAGLEPGDVLSYRVVVRQQPLSPGRVFGDFKFPPLPGALAQQYELDLPRGGDIKVRLRDGLGAAWEELPSPPDRLVRRLRVTVDLPSEKTFAEKKERRKWLEPDVSFTSFRSWNEMASWWWGLSRDRVKPDAAATRQAAELTARAGSPREKLGALFGFVAGRVRYLNVSFRLGRMQPRPAPDVLQNLYGDCKDKQALLTALASAAGIDVRPVLINTSDVELHDEAPGPQQFDHVIGVARLGPSPADWLWMDSTEAFASAGYLRPPLRDKSALVVEADGTATLVRTPKEPPFVPRHEASLTGTLDAAGVLHAHATWTLRSDTEVVLRALLASTAQEQRASLVKSLFLSDWKDPEVRNVSLSEALDTSAPFRIEFDLEAKAGTRGNERTLGLPVPDDEPPKPDDPVVAGEPPVTFGVRELVARAEIEVAEGLTAAAPLSVALDRPFGSFKSAYSVDGRRLHMERSLSFRQPSLAEADLDAYQAFRGAVSTDRKQEFTIEGAPALAGAAGLLAEGRAAFDSNDYARAAELLAKAAEADPKAKDAFSYLGESLHKLARYQEAVAAFTREIEGSPYDETAYAWRAHSLLALHRGEEAEKDLLKQIEVAPFKAWSYDRMGERRREQGRWAEAADFYARAAAIEPKEAEHWLDLGTVQARAGQAGEASRSLERAMALDAKDWMKVNAATTFRRLGQVARAGELAQSALPSLRNRLAALTRDTFDDGDDYWIDRLIEAWVLVGEAALVAEDSARAEAYLDAAWKVAFAPQAAWALGELRNKQGRRAEAAQLWTMAADVPTAPAVLPAGYKARLEAANRSLPTPAAAQPRLMELRTVRLSGSTLGQLTEEVLVLTDADGAVQSIVNVSGKDSSAFDRQMAKLGRVQLPAPRPDGEPVKLVRRALLVCATVSGCALVIDLPGTDPLPAKAAR